MTEVDKAIRYIFVITVLLLFLAYFAGAKQLFSAGTASIVSLMRAGTGQNPQGTGFLPYPTGA
ncbi:MAG TPA: hypothetical protein VFK47_10880 [Ktedonobacteraceae bacterium]|nr:hypothetical protein [Ktedonobacteraceae bacterium]